MTEKSQGGRRGKRLWLRTNDKRWIEIPYGAGQDPKIRSLNVYDGYQWLTPAFANREMEHEAQVPSLEVALPGVEWIGSETATSPINIPYWNPNYQVVPGPHVQSYMPMNANWTRLFHTMPRKDPTWRIVALNRQVVKRVPNRTIVSPDDYLYFWPSLNEHRLTVTDGAVDETLDWNSSAFPAEYLALASVERNYSGVYTNRTSTISTILDLANIRKRLEDDYEVQNEDFTGQYTSIKKMQLRRVVIRASISTLTSVAPIVVHLHSASNVAATTVDVEDPGWNRSYSLQIPADTQPPNTLTPDYTGTGNVGNVSVVKDLKYETPGESNLAFFATVDGVPATSASIPSALGQIRVIPQRIALHYAEPGHDTPSELHTDPMAIG